MCVCSLKMEMEIKKGRKNRAHAHRAESVLEGCREGKCGKKECSESFFVLFLKIQLHLTEQKRRKMVLYRASK